MKEQKKKNNLQTLSLLIVPAILILILALFMKNSDSSENTLVVYCSHDSVFAEEILKEFTQKTGIKVIPKFDTEASKSLGLTEKILFEKDQSECDVYWSNEILSMPSLKNAGLLMSYKGPGYQRIPEKFKDTEGYWCGFAARLRVIIYNKEKFNGSYDEVANALNSESLNEVTIALPLYGTTLTHFAAMWITSGGDSLKQQYKSWKERQIQIVPGNGPARNLVANGTCKFGWTDTDDFFGAVDKNAPVGMFPCRLEDKSTICIPNTVGIIKHTGKADAAKKLVDYLLSEEIEVKLAHSESRQIPLGKTDKELPEEVKNLLPYAEEGTDLKKVFEIRDTLIDWIKNEESLK